MKRTKTLMESTVDENKGTHLLLFDVISPDKKYHLIDVQSQALLMMLMLEVQYSLDIANYQDKKSFHETR